MSTLTPIEKSKLERLFDMSNGYVLNFSDADIGNFFGSFNVDIHSRKYMSYGSSKAKKLREFWRIEDDLIVGETIKAMIELYESWEVKEAQVELLKQCKDIYSRLLTGKVNLTSLKQVAEKLDLQAIDRQIKRIEKSIDDDPDLAIGTSKELIESCCKTILHEMEIHFDEKKLDVPQLTKLTLEKLKLTPDTIDPFGKGADITKKILGNLGQISHNMAELRNLYGTGHGKAGKTSSLQARHARLAVSCASAFTHFVFETFEELTKLEAK